ncbi:type III-B CRISPR module-associated Cmr3 family protein [Alysiella filiformis]|uniref:CRISPR-associated protein Cmr3 n=1 Tax=Alysiella filiformis DSM 16848 TaxID=1120981 RepID=A0A286ESY6_9NEIS|nr:type III-B CRISPR module-associated Cmr3 family protein [Alysiella filiformis]QMT32132.1 type III-B CRISPR module-associated protein Cmr3 [Alysiella filiformis]UBQ56952.1 type III-B CRISPR module-associated protein Cmr3 [Alysiella filiformis DSM 16848]SOD74061.1 CRISPR-associated protein Cmr3 [Alysiella filiformis DSM 16848]
MNAYLIESLAPLVFRNAKPFGHQANAQELAFPNPSTGAGLIRYLALSQGKVDNSHYDTNYQDLLKIQCFGVYLARFDDNKAIQIFVPKPANALCLENDNKQIELIRLLPKAFDGDCGSDLPAGLLPIQPEKTLKGKPKGNINYWRLEDFIKWQQGEKLEYDTIKEGISTIPNDIRTHIMRDDDTHATVDGKLFQTASFDLGYQKNNDGFDSHRLGFVILSKQELDDDLATLGGERRLSYFKKLKNQILFTKPTADEINQAGGFSLSFMTPVIFEQGYLPRWIDKNTMTGQLPSGTKIKLISVAVERWQAISGWDSQDWKPKATRKAVSAGAVYWFELLDNNQCKEQDIDFLTAPLADNAYDQADGFGMALLTAFKPNT